MSNDEPKVSPSVMKAAEKVADYFDEHGVIRIPDVANLINDTTHLSAKEAALRELVEELGNCEQAIQYVYATFDYHRPALDSLRAALAKAKEALDA